MTYCTRLLQFVNFSLHVKSASVRCGSTLPCLHMNLLRTSVRLPYVNADGLCVAGFTCIYGTCKNY